MIGIGDRVVYGSHGVCLVTQTEERRIDRKDVTYLVLEPVGQEGSRYLVPTHNAAAMAKLTPLLTRPELELLLSDPDARGEDWISDENQRKQTYRELMACGDRGRLVRMVGSLYRHREALAAAGKRFHLCDENFLRDAERLLSSEVAIVLDIDREQARAYLQEKLRT